MGENNPPPGKNLLGSLKDSGENLLEAAVDATKLATTATKNVVNIADAALNATSKTALAVANTAGNVGVKVTKNAGKVAIAGSNAASKITVTGLDTAVSGTTAAANIAKTAFGTAVSGSKAAAQVANVAFGTTVSGSKAAAKIANVAFNTTATIAGAAGNVVSSTAVDAAQASKQSTKEILKQAGDITESATRLLGSTATAVTDLVARVTTAAAASSHSAIANTTARRKVADMSDKFVRNAIIIEYNNILTNFIKQFAVFFKGYSTLFGELIYSYKDTTCKKGYLYGHRCDDKANADIMLFKKKFSEINDTFKMRMTELKSSSTFYTAKIQTLSPAADTNMVEEAQKVTSENFATFSGNMQRITQDFENLSTMMRTKPDQPIQSGGKKRRTRKARRKQARK